MAGERLSAFLTEFRGQTLHDKSGEVRDQLARVLGGEGFAGEQVEEAMARYDEILALGGDAAVLGDDGAEESLELEKFQKWLDQLRESQSSTPDPSVKVPTLGALQPPGVRHAVVNAARPHFRAVAVPISGDARPAAAPAPVRDAAELLGTDNAAELPVLRRLRHFPWGGDPTTRAVQTMLFELGYLDGLRDGKFGPNTTRAVRDFQVQSGIRNDGVVGPDTWDHLIRSWEGAPSPASPEAPSVQASPSAALLGAADPRDLPILRQQRRFPPGGDDTVRDLQTVLRELGHLQGDSDGKFGRKTAEAVRDFQRGAGIEVDGVVGPQTWEQLSNAVKPQHQEARPEGEAAADRAVAPDEGAEPAAVAQEDGDTGDPAATRDDDVVAPEEDGVAGASAGEGADEPPGVTAEDAEPPAAAAPGGPAPEAASPGPERESPAESLESVSHIGIDRILDENMQDEDVRRTREMLRAIGFDLEAGDLFDASMYNAVREFQERYSQRAIAPLDVDGRVGPATGQAMRSAFAWSLANPERRWTEFVSSPDYVPPHERPLEIDGSVRLSASVGLRGVNRTDDAVTMQRRLRDLGYYVGPVDGNFGRSSRSSLALAIAVAEGRAGPGPALLRPESRAAERIFSAKMPKWVRTHTDADHHHFGTDFTARVIAGANASYDLLRSKGTLAGKNVAEDIALNDVSTFNGVSEDHSSHGAGFDIDVRYYQRDGRTPGGVTANTGHQAVNAATMASFLVQPEVRRIILREPDADFLGHLRRALQELGDPDALSKLKYDRSIRRDKKTGKDFYPHLNHYHVDVVYDEFEHPLV